MEKSWYKNQADPRKNFLPHCLLVICINTGVSLREKGHHSFLVFAKIDKCLVNLPEILCVYNVYNRVENTEECEASSLDSKQLREGFS